MFGNNQTADNALLKTVTQRLSRGTGSQSKVTATVQQGTVTLSGGLQYDAQRSPLIKLVARIAGVRRVIDQLKLIPKTVYPPYQPASPDAAASLTEAPAPPEAILPAD